MVRIRYNKTSEGLISIPVLIGSTIFQGVISTSFVVTILNSKGEEVSNVQGRNLLECKALVKKEMRRLGATFGDEVRLSRRAIREAQDFAKKEYSI